MEVNGKIIYWSGNENKVENWIGERRNNRVKGKAKGNGEGKGGMGKMRETDWRGGIRVRNELM